MVEYCYAVSYMLRVTYKPFMVIVIMLGVVMLSVVAPNFISDQRYDS
jgi:hypothetical protein